MRTYTTILFQPNGEETIVKLNQSKPSLDEMQAAVGGLIQAVDYHLNQKVSHHIRAYCNEEFLYMDPRPNLVGTAGVQWHHMLCGPIFVYFTSKNEKAHNWFAEFGVPGLLEKV
jgi:hypothetical protein